MTENLLERLKKDFAAEEQKSISIDLKDGNGPFIIYWSPVTMADRDFAFEKAGGKVSLKFSVYLVIRKAKDAVGNNIFKTADFSDLFYKVDPGIIVEISNAMLNVASVEEMEKNL